MNPDARNQSRFAPEDGYELWLRYERIADQQRCKEYLDAFGRIELPSGTETLEVIRRELILGLEGLLNHVPDFSPDNNDTRLIIGTPKHSPTIRSLKSSLNLDSLGNDGFTIAKCPVGNQSCWVVAGNTDVGILYGVFHLLFRIGTLSPLEWLAITSKPRLTHRVLNHWDNLDRTVERGYAGFSLWNWDILPDYVDPRLIDYARANASIGINGTVLTNVNANALILTPQYLLKVQKLAEVFRPYGLRVYLPARFSAPIEIGGLETADPFEERVAKWWQDKANEIYQIIPDFGGFIVKANSEGQPGPQKYGRTHADGANVLARALMAHGGIVMWRAFVYDSAVQIDRAKQANLEFEPLDGQFFPNACVQVKNGAIDFQPREPFHPLLGRMPKTPLFLEVQLTQEYLGHSTHWVFLAPMLEGVLRSDTHANDEGSTVARIIDGSVHSYGFNGIAAVANIGNDRNWCGHPMAAANWYAYGRLSWDLELTSRSIADEWLKLTYSRDPIFVESITELMIASHQACVNYMTPLGLHHIMAWDHHKGPGPWIDQGRPDWTSVYYHRASEDGIGFDRTSKGSNAVEQYFPDVRDQFESLDRCPEEFLLWFHHVPWDHLLKSGKTLWDELCLRYQYGVDTVRYMQKTWQSFENVVDPYRFRMVSEYLKIQEKEARFWRDGCTLYFQTFSKRPIPDEVEPASHPLDYYRNYTLYYVPGIPERRFKVY
jgi:alpha-glucuronidase